MFACLELYATTNAHPRLEINFQHSLPSLHSLGVARENQLKVSAMRSDKYKGILGIVLGPCTLEADGEVSLASNETGWVLAFRNKCVTLEVSSDCFLHALPVCVFQITESQKKCLLTHLWIGQIWSLKLFWQSNDSEHLQGKWI